MSEFYDLNELLAFCLRKIKVAVAIILVAILGFCGMRLVDMPEPGERTAAKCCCFRGTDVE